MPRTVTDHDSSDNADDDGRWGRRGREERGGARGEKRGEREGLAEKVQDVRKQSKA